MTDFSFLKEGDKYEMLTKRWHDPTKFNLNLRYCTCFEQGVPWHYRVHIHSKMCMWYDNNMQSWHDPFEIEAKLTNILVTICPSFKEFSCPSFKGKVLYQCGNSRAQN